MAAVSKRCCVPNCGLTTLLHKFPNPNTEIERFRTWLYNVGGDILGFDNEYILKHRKVCHIHFETRYHTRNKMLSIDAIPTLNLSNLLSNQCRTKNTTQKTLDVSPASPSISETWILEKDLCRCCHKEGSFKNLAEPCKFSDLTEIYSDMLRDCFDIDMVPVPGMLCAVTYTICEACILRLRDATDFKKQVQSCEERFRDLCNRNVIKADAAVVIDVKEEIPDTYQDDDFNEEFSQDDNDIEDYDDRIEFKTSETEHKPEKEEGRRKKKKLKTKKTEKKSCRSVERTKKVKEESEEGAENDGQKKKGRTAPPKFRLNDEDYKKNGEEYQCSRCDKKYYKIFSLRFHVKTKHYKIPRYSCPICLKEFMTPAPLTVHKLEAHNIDDRFKCKACKGTFNTKVQLRKHINNFHMLGARYKCEFCEYESFSFEGMYKHKFKHKTVKDYHCRFCRKSFLRKTTLDLHERIHTGDRRKVCSVCGQAFVQKASLNYHMTKYHPEVNF